MNTIARSAPAWVLAVMMAAQSPVLQIQVLEGDGAVHRAGSRGASALRVRITDQFGNPVPGALVTFRLPDDGPTGTFANGLNTEVVTAGPEGDAQTPGVRWSQAAGPLYVRIAAVKDQLRAGTAILQTIAAANGAERSPQTVAVRPGPLTSPRKKFRAKWFLIGVAVAAAGAGFAIGRSGDGAGPAPQAPVRIGTPTITIGKF